MRSSVAILGVPFLVACLASCGANDHTSAPVGPGGDATTGDSGEDGNGASGGSSSSGGTSSSGASSSGASSSGASSSGASSGGVSSSGSSSSGASSGGASSGGGSSGAASSSGGVEGGLEGGVDGGTHADAGSDAGAADFSVYQHHKNGTRNGLYIDPVLTSGTGGNAATMHVLGFMGTVTTNVYAQPLYVQSGIPNITAEGAFIVATENNHVTAIDGSNGATMWDKGPTTYAPYYASGSGLPCGDITPLGITGTPIIDPASPINGGAGVIYFDAMTTPDGGTTLKHLVYAVKLADGTVLPNWPVDVSATVSGFNSPHQNQRGALQFVNGILYVPYGGHDGDCNPYHGWVVGIPVATPQSPTGWHTTAARGGIWGPGALPTDGTSVFPITGNTQGATTWGGGEAVIRLTAGPAFSGNTADYYAPSNWAALDGSDTDLGGASEVLFDMPGATPPNLVAAGGKDGHLYLLNRDNLGGIGGELYNQPMATNQFKGAPIAYSTSQGTYVAFHVEGGSGMGCPTGQTGNLVAFKITGGTATAKPTASVAWCSTQSGLASPMVTTTDGTSDAIVWDANNHLWAYDGNTGASLVSGTNTGMSTGIQSWNTPIAAGQGRIAIGVNGQLYIFSAP